MNNIHAENMYTTRYVHNTHIYIYTIDLQHQIYREQNSQISSRITYTSHIKKILPKQAKLYIQHDTYTGTIRYT